MQEARMANDEKVLMIRVYDVLSKIVSLTDGQTYHGTQFACNTMPFINNHFLS